MFSNGEPKCGKGVLKWLEHLVDALVDSLNLSNKNLINCLEVCMYFVDCIDYCRYLNSN